jgi:hypothetical protein
VILPPGQRDTSAEARKRRMKAIAGWAAFGLLVVFFLYKAFTIGPGVHYAPPKIDMFVASGSKAEGEVWRVVLTWGTSNADDVEISPMLGKVEPNGSKTVELQQDTTFNMVAKGPGGEATYELQVQVTSK